MAKDNIEQLGEEVEETWKKIQAKKLKKRIWIVLKTIFAIIVIADIYLIFRHFF